MKFSLKNGSLRGKVIVNVEPFGQYLKGKIVESHEKAERGKTIIFPIADSSSYLIEVDQKEEISKLMGILNN